VSSEVVGALAGVYVAGWVVAAAVLLYGDRNDTEYGVLDGPYTPVTAGFAGALWPVFAAIMLVVAPFWLVGRGASALVSLAERRRA
jgi:hypothetical protein